MQVNKEQELNEEQKIIFDAVMKSTKPFIIIQGKAGTGKSFLVNEIQKKLQCNILVPTNMAKSVYLSNNKVSTVHSFFISELDELSNGYQDPFNYLKAKDTRVRNRIYSEKYLILDEVSMIRADLFEMMNKVCQIAKGNTLPFGGIKIIAVGDMLQLPPIVPETPAGEDNALLRYLQDTYGGVYFFNSKIIQENLDKIDFFELKKSIRQSEDTEYEELLDIIREPSSQTDYRKKLRFALEKINQRVFPSENIPQNESITKIVTTNSEVEKINASQLALLPGEEQISSAKFKIYKRGDKDAPPIEFEGSSVPPEHNTKDYYPIDIPSKFAAVLKYKIGAKVMFTENFKRYQVYNGDFGIIKEVKPEINSIVVTPIKQPRPDVEVQRRKNTSKELIYNAKTKKMFVGNTKQETEQYPLKSGYAFTVHKSQGQTYDRVIVDMSDKGMFAPGQLYVALSRVKSLQGLFLTKRLTTSDCMVSLPLIGFLNQMRAKKEIPIIPSEMLADEVLSDSCQKFKEKVINSKLAKYVKDDIYTLLEHYSNSYKDEKYQFAMSELERILDKIESVCADKILLKNISNIRRSLQKNATKEACDNNIEKIGDLCSLIGYVNSAELFQTDHHTLIQQPDRWENEIVFNRAEQTGWTYEKLFAKYLQGATQITLKEPYLIHDFQFSNLREFIDLLLKIKDPNTDLDLDIVTLRGNDSQYIAKTHHVKTCYRDKRVNIEFDYKERNELHDREIITNTGWKMWLGRGLHIWQEDRNREREPHQANRPCFGGFNILYLKTKNISV